MCEAIKNQDYIYQLFNTSTPAQPLHRTWIGFGTACLGSAYFFTTSSSESLPFCMSFSQARRWFRARWRIVSRPLCASAENSQIFFINGIDCSIWSSSSSRYLSGAPASQCAWNAQ